MDKTNVIIVSAPSGSGKSTLVGRLLEKVPGLVFSISYTTREPRGKEQNGQDYFFVTPGEFRQMLDANGFLEHAEVFGTHYYGTSRRFLDEARAEGKDLLLDIDVQGAKQVREKLPETVSVFILPPSRAELEHRLRFRRLDPEHVIERRLKQAATEIRGYSAYDYVLINKDLEHASNCLNAIVLAARARRNGDTSPEAAEWQRLAESCRTAVVKGEIQPILDTFESITESSAKATEETK
jgi:guanylate kinase